MVPWRHARAACRGIAAKLARQTGYARGIAGDGPGISREVFMPSRP